MPLLHHPMPGTIVVCDFRVGFKPPEMVKRRPSIVISPQIQQRGNLCTVVPISTDKPHRPMSYHLELLHLKLPPPYEEGPNWVKADMVFAASFERLELLRVGKDNTGKRLYNLITLSTEDLKKVRAAVICSLGLSALTKHL